MTELAPAPAPLEAPAHEPLAIRVESLAWAAAMALFVTLRIGPIAHAPVWGAELAGLSGAWQARIGVADDRFAPTLFQAITTLTLHWTASDIPARLIAFVVTASIPAALWFLRPKLGDIPALIALIILALDPFGILFGSSASAMAFDLAIAAWLFVALTRPSLPAWLAAPAAFAVVTAGPIALPLVVAWLALTLICRDYPSRAFVLFGAAGLTAGLLLTSLRFGMGPDGGIRIPPFSLFADGFDRAWSSPNTFELAALYGTPLFAGGIAAWLVGVRRLLLGYDADRTDSLLILWAGIALAWAIASATSHNPAPLAALALPLALLLGPALLEALTAMFRADWSLARWLVPLAIFAALVAVSFMLDWARNQAVGPGGEKLLVAMLLLIALGAVLVVAYYRDSLPALLAFAFAVSALPALSSAFGLAFASRGEPAYSPYSPAQARDIRDMALQTVHDNGGLIVVHPDFEDDMTWPFRDSGTVVVSSRIPPDAGFVVWPAGGAKPDGYSQLDGQWTLLREPAAPVSGFLDYLRWFTNRNTLDLGGEPVSIYVRAAK